MTALSQLDNVTPILAGLARRYAGPDCDDLLQEMLIKIASIKGQRPAPYLITAGRYVALHWLRSEGRRSAHVEIELDQFFESSQTKTGPNMGDSAKDEYSADELEAAALYNSLAEFRPIEAQSEREELSERVSSVMAQLPPRLYRVAVLMMQGDSKKEIARKMGLSRQTIHAHIKQIKAAFAGLQE